MRLLFIIIRLLDSYGWVVCVRVLLDHYRFIGVLTSVHWVKFKAMLLWLWVIIVIGVK
jgi:hypothetical protein